MTITKEALVKIICDKTGFTLQEASKYLEQLLEIMKEALEKSEKVKIFGFGNFIVHEKRPRKGRNPKTAEQIMLSRRRVLRFKASPVLRKAVNQGGLSSSESGESLEDAD